MTARSFILGLPIALTLASNSFAADFKMSVVETGKRDYYCTVGARLENRSSAELQEINGFFVSYVEDTESGQSNGSSFLNVAPGENVEKTFETPNGPCTEDGTAITGYRFVVVACRVDGSFIDQAECAKAIEYEMPIQAINAR